jgi:hypothetical protein
MEQRCSNTADSLTQGGEASRTSVNRAKPDIASTMIATDNRSVCHCVATRPRV